MKDRKAVAGLAGVAVLATVAFAGTALATHREEGYSPCRPGSDEYRLGYSDDGDQSDPRHELPTIYANGGPGNGNLGICGGSGEDIQSIEVSVGPDYAPGGVASVKIQGSVQLPSVGSSDEPEEGPDACSDPGIMTNPTLGQYLYDTGLVAPFVQDPDADGPVSGPVDDVADPAHPVLHDPACLISLLPFDL